MHQHRGPRIWQHSDGDVMSDGESAFSVMAPTKCHNAGVIIKTFQFADPREHP